MSKLDEDPSLAGRQRQLNIIYFIDSSKTHTLTMSLNQFRWVLGFFLTLIIWSVASIAIVFGLQSEKTSLEQRLQVALSTVFDYETRVDNVFEIAYPPQPKSATPPTDIASDQKKTASSPSNQLALADKDKTPKQPSVTGTSELDQKPAVLSQAEQAGPSVDEDEEAIVAIGRPNLLTHPNSLELKFDLTTRPGVDFVEGYIFAVAEFTSDQGEKLFIGAPKDIAVSDKGVPTQPLKATSFAIKRFKQKGLKFPLIPNKTGTFTKVHIAVIGTQGQAISSYDLPVKLHIGKQGWDKSPRTGGAAKSG
ncbi:MAG: hypothetical protein FJ146_02710 [Deltaproteobacteria bacterium]|nr:hypothetical protein [Deltaproteobacteria bacterium]